MRSSVLEHLPICTDEGDLKDRSITPSSRFRLRLPEDGRPFVLRCTRDMAATIAKERTAVQHGEILCSASLNTAAIGRLSHHRDFEAEQTLGSPSTLLRVNWPKRRWAQQIGVPQSGTRLYRRRLLLESQKRGGSRARAVPRYHLRLRGGARHTKGPKNFGRDVV